LNNNYGSTKSRFRGNRFRELRPPYRASLHHHSSEGSDFLSAAMNPCAREESSSS
jgi:hypothetical protein